MADTFTKADVERLVADALKLQQAEHKSAVEELKRAAAKSEQQKQADAALEEARAKQRALRLAAIAAQGDVPRLKYVVGPSGAYNNGAVLESGGLAWKPNTPDPGPSGTAEAVAKYLRDMPSIDWAPYEPNKPKVAAEPEKRGAVTAAEMNRLDQQRPKTGVQAPAKKGGRPSDTEV